MSYTCLMFGEGGKDKKFLTVLVDLDKFKFHTKNWFFTIDSASGSSPEIILRRCTHVMSLSNYTLVLCFIDLDVLKNENPKDWQEKKNNLEAQYSNINIIWQIDNAEDEFRKVLGNQYLGKTKLNKMARKNVKNFINSEFWKKILNLIESTEQGLR
jgi:hypothetical protein